MQINREHPYDIDCVMIHEMLQARTSEKNRETATYAARVVEERMTSLQNRREGEDMHAAADDRELARARKRGKTWKLSSAGWRRGNGVFQSSGPKAATLCYVWHVVFWRGSEPALFFFFCTFLHRASSPSRMIRNSSFVLSSLFRFSHNVQIHFIGLTSHDPTVVCPSRKCAISSNSNPPTLSLRTSLS